MNHEKGEVDALRVGEHARTSAVGRPSSSESEVKVPVERVQTGVRLERHLLKVLKALAEYLDLSLGDLIEGIALHAFEGRSPFGEDTLQVIEKLKAIYGLTLTAEDSHLLIDTQREAGE